MSVRSQRLVPLQDQGGLAAFVGDLPLSQDGSVVVGDRGDQEHPSGRGDGTTQEFAVDRDRGEQPGRGVAGHRLGGRAALFAFGRAGGFGDLRDWPRGYRAESLATLFSKPAPWPRPRRR